MLVTADADHYEWSRVVLNVPFKNFWSLFEEEPSLLFSLWSKHMARQVYGLNMARHIWFKQLLVWVFYVKIWFVIETQNIYICEIK